MQNQKITNIDEYKARKETESSVSIKALDRKIAAAEKAIARAKGLKGMLKDTVKQAATAAGLAGVKFEISEDSALNMLASSTEELWRIYFDGEDNAYEYRVYIAPDEAERGAYMECELTRKYKETGQRELYSFEDGSWSPVEDEEDEWDAQGREMRPEDYLFRGYTKKYCDVVISKLVQVKEKNKELLELAYALDDDIREGAWFNFTDGDDANFLVSPDCSGLCVQYYGGEYHARLYMMLAKEEKPFGDAFHTADVAEMAEWLARIFSRQYEYGTQCIIPLSKDAVFVIVNPDGKSGHGYTLNFAGREAWNAEERAMYEEAHKRIAESMR